MRNLIRAAVIAVPAALMTVPSPAQAMPQVAAGWLIAAGVGGLVVGILAANNAYARPVVATQYPVTRPIEVGYQCQMVKVKYQGRWRRATICD